MYTIKALHYRGLLFFRLNTAVVKQMRKKSTNNQYEDNLYD